MDFRIEEARQKDFDEKKYFFSRNSARGFLSGTLYVKSIAASAETQGLLSRRDPVKYPA